MQSASTVLSKLSFSWNGICLSGLMAKVLRFKWDIFGRFRFRSWFRFKIRRNWSPFLYFIIRVTSVWIFVKAWSFWGLIRSLFVLDHWCVWLYLLTEGIVIAGFLVENCDASIHVLSCSWNLDILFFLRSL